ncbi:hypothetical protein BP6252_12645 [Coleophoma cylindrospora]|uniref:Clr5 domain-containing protein n=1 Tax=Coleophoma cylindrospora TaxID=1849047 RepID=A0A3D8QD75_9HELO|nr:hypothetical protein BP6252_12645 [Coleophoma cylindrospora]
MLKVVHYEPGPSRPRAKITESEWQMHRAQLERYHKTEKLNDIIQLMDREHGFRPSRRQYIQKFKEWELCKNVPKRDMKVMIRKAAQRTANGKDATVFQWHGQLVESHKLDRFRQQFPDWELPNSPFAATPPYISVSTPGKNDDPYIGPSFIFESHTGDNPMDKIIQQCLEEIQNEDERKYSHLPTQPASSISSELQNLLCSAMQECLVGARKSKPSINSSHDRIFDGIQKFRIQEDIHFQNPDRQDMGDTVTPPVVSSNNNHPLLWKLSATVQNENFTVDITEQETASPVRMREKFSQLLDEASALNQGQLIRDGTEDITQMKRKLTITITPTETNDRIKRQAIFRFTQHTISSRVIKLTPVIIFKSMIPGNSEVFDIASSGTVRELRELLELPKVSINVCDPQGRSLLNYAAGNGNLEMIRFLAEFIEDVDAFEPDQGGFDSLNYQGSLRVALDYGEYFSNASSTGAEGELPPLLIVCSTYSGGTSDEIDTAAKVILLLQRGADILVKDPTNGFNCFHYILSHEKPSVRGHELDDSITRDILMILLTAGADVYGTTNSDISVSEIAHWNNRGKLWSEVLGIYGYDPEAVSAGDTSHQSRLNISFEEYIKAREPIYYRDVLTACDHPKGCRCHFQGFAQELDEESDQDSNEELSMMDDNFEERSIHTYEDSHEKLEGNPNTAPNDEESELDDGFDENSFHEDESDGHFENPSDQSTETETETNHVFDDLYYENLKNMET